MKTLKKLVQRKNRQKLIFTPLSAAIIFVRKRSMDEYTFGGAVLFILLILAAVGDGLGEYHANQLITECEKTLPRNQRCVLTAVLKEVK